MTSRDLKGLQGRQAIASTLQTLFPHLSASNVAVSETRGGRLAAEATLAVVKPQSYERTRNFLKGEVTHLSAYLRHGVLTLAEVRDAALLQVRNPQEAGKLINEYAWRDYWQRLYAQMGEGIWQDREPWKTGYSAPAYQKQLPAEIPTGGTTLRCIDSFAHDLVKTGYLHNHVRMWFAAYLVHWRRVHWQAGASWFLEHLIDGDPASNNLSWQWVASTFATKPYFFNRENLERYTDGIYCRTCPHAQTRTCPFDHDYEALEQTLFPRLHSPVEANAMPSPPRPFTPTTERPSSKASGKPLLWVHTDALNPKSPMLLAHPDSRSVFVWDQQWIVTSSVSLKRLVFLTECLQEMPAALEIRVGDPAAEVLAAAKTAGADYILAQRTPDPRLLAAAAELGKHLPVAWYDPPPFVESTRGFDLKRFSRYWQRAQSAAMQPTRSN